MNLVASLPGAVRALLAGRLHSRVPATILIAIGAFVATLGDTLNRFGMTEWFQLGKFLGVLFLFAGFLVSIEVFREIRIPFTSIRLEPDAARAGRRRSSWPPPPSLRRTSATTTAAGAGRRSTASGGPSAIGPTMAPHVLPTCSPQPSRPPRTARPRRVSLIVIVAASLFGMLGPLSRFAYDAGMEPLPFVVWRGLVGLIATAIFVAWRIRGGHMHLTRWGDLDRGARLSLGVAALMGFTLNLAMFIAFDLVTIALALLGFYTYPVIVAVVERRARARDARPAARRRARPSRSPGWSPSSPRSSTRRPGSASMRSGSGWPSARRSARPSSWSSAGPATGRCRPPRRWASSSRRPSSAGSPSRLLTGAGDGARLPAARPVDPAAARLHRPVRRGHPVDPVPDRDPARSAARGPGS